LSNNDNLPSEYQFILTARNQSLRDVKTKLSSLNQCLDAQAQADLKEQGYWLKRWNSQVTMIKQALKLDLPANTDTA
jgi:hypothetical protein